MSASSRFYDLLEYLLSFSGRPTAPPAAKRVNPKPIQPGKGVEETFADITEELTETIVVAYTQRPEEITPEYDLTGTDDYETAIALTIRGLMAMVLDDLGVWHGDMEDEDDG